jgi:hypothetical protein
VRLSFNGTIAGMVLALFLYCESSFAKSLPKL